MDPIESFLKDHINESYWIKSKSNETWLVDKPSSYLKRLDVHNYIKREIFCTCFLSRYMDRSKIYVYTRNVRKDTNCSEPTVE